MQALLERSRGDFAFTALVVAGTAVFAALYALSAYAVSPWALPGVTAAAAFGVLVLYRPDLGLAGAVLAAPLEVLHLQLGPGALSPTEVAFLLVGLGWIGRALLAPETIARPGVEDLSLGTLLGAMAVGLIIAPSPGPVARVLVFWLLFVCVYFQAASLTREQVRVVLRAFAVGAGLLGAIGAVTYLRGGGGGLLGGGTITTKRAIGAFSDANYFASFLILGLMPAIALSLSNLRRNWWLLVPAAFGIAGIVFSLSRGGIAGFAIGLLLLLLWRRARWIAFVLVALFTVLTLANANPIVKSQQFQVVEERISTLNPAVTSATTTRPRIWRTALAIFSDHPFFGVGALQFRTEAAHRGLLERGKPLENAHNIPLNFLAETGIVGLAGFLAFCVQLVLRSATALRRASGADYAVPLGIAAALLGFAIQGLTVTQVRVTVVAAAFLMLAGLLTAEARRPAAGGQVS